MEDIPKFWLISVDPNIVTIWRIMKYPERGERNTEFLKTLELGGKEVFLNELLDSALAIQIHRSHAKPKRKKKAVSTSFQQLTHIH